MRTAGKALYPAKMKRAGRLAVLRRWTFWGLVFGCALSVFINLLTTEFPWSLYVVLGSYVFYTGMISRSTVDASLLSRLLMNVISGCAILLLAEYLGSAQWATRTAVPMVLFGGVLSSALLYLGGIAAQRVYLTPFALMVFVGLWFPFFALDSLGFWSWANITLLATSLGVLLVSIIFFHRPILRELNKKTSTR